MIRSKQHDGMRVRRVRLGGRRMIGRIAAMESDIFSDPWSRHDFIDEIRRGSRVLVAQDGERNLLGYIVFRVTRTRTNVLNLCVEPGVQRSGIESALLAEAFDTLSPLRRCLCAVVSERNLPMQLFLRARDFRCVAQVRDSSDADEHYVFEHVTGDRPWAREGVKHGQEHED